MKSTNNLTTAQTLNNNPKNINIYPTKNFPYLNKYPIPSPKHLQKTTPNKHLSKPKFHPLYKYQT